MNAATQWWVWLAALSACFVLCGCLFVLVPVWLASLRSRPPPRTPTPAHLTQPPGPPRLGRGLRAREFETAWARKYVGRPYTDYLEGLFDQEKEAAARRPTPVVVLRQGTSQTTTMPGGAKLVLVDAQGRFLGKADAAQFGKPSVVTHAGVVAQWSDFMLQYTPTKPGARYEW